MARPDDDVPQTADAARAAGWTWLQVQCLSCRHKAQLDLKDISATMPGQPLSAYARRLRCSACAGQTLEYELGAYIQSAGQPWHESKPIAFDLGKTVRPYRG